MFKRCRMMLLKWAWWQLVGLSIVLGVLIEAVGCNYLYWLQFVQNYEKVVVLDSANRYASDQEVLAGSVPQTFAKQPLNVGPVMLSPDRSSLSMPLNDIVVRNVRIDVYHPANPKLLITGKISVKTSAQKYLFHQNGSFTLTTNAKEANNVILADRQNVRELKVSFDIPSNSTFYLSAVIVNDDINMNFRPLRFILWMALILVPLLVWRYRIYAQAFDLNQASHRYLNLGCLGINILLVLSILYVNNTITGENLKSRCIFPQQCTFSYGSDHGSLLQPMPRTYDELFNSHIYTQQFDAWLKGQTYLDLQVDPRVAQMQDPHDMTEFYYRNVGWLFDHVIYNQRYYCYYGPSVLILVYAPIYALTGQVPTILLADTILVLWAVLMMHWAVTMWYRSFGFKGNLLLFLLAQLALPAAGMVFVNQLTAYTYTSAMTTSASMLAFGYAAWNYRGFKRYLCALLSGFFLVMLELSRPHELLVVIWFFIPMFWAGYQRIKFMLSTKRPAQAPDSIVAQAHAANASNAANVANTAHTANAAWRATESANAAVIPNSANSEHSGNSSQDNWFKVFWNVVDVKAWLCWGIIVLIGAIGVMYYNYVRFDSPLRFGDTLMVTASLNPSAMDITFNLSNILDALYNVVWDSTGITNEFPFINFASPTPDVKSYHTFPSVSSGLLTFGLNWAIFLLLLGRQIPAVMQQKHSQDSGVNGAEHATFNDVDDSELGFTLLPQEQDKAWWVQALRSALPATMRIVALMAIVIGVFNIVWAANLLRVYTLEGAWYLSFIAVFLILMHIHWGQAKASKILYGIAIYALVSSWILGYVWSMQSEYFMLANKDIVLNIINFFRPFMVTN